MQVEQLAVEQQSAATSNENSSQLQSIKLPNAFRWLWTGQSVSLIGSRLSALSFQVIAVSTLHATSSQMGILTASETIPYLVFGLFVGVLVDRTSRRRLLIGCDLVRFVILAAACLLAFTGRLNLPLMWAIVCIVSTFNLIFDSALGAYIPQILARTQWLRANSRLSITQSASEVAGPGLAGYLLQAVAAPAVMLIDGLTYAISALCILIGRPTALSSTPQPSHPSPLTELNLWSSIKQGASFVYAHPILRIFAIWSAVWNFSWSALLAVFVLYATRSLSLSPRSIGLIFAVGGIGGVTGSAIAGPLAAKLSRGRVLVCAPAIGAAGGALVFAARGAHAFVILLLAMFLYSLGESAFGVNMQTCRQEVTPFELMGRMDTTMRLCFRGMASLGALTGGFIGSAFGLRTTILSAVCGLILTVLGLQSSGLSHLVDARNTSPRLETKS
jgi:MFS family permease